MKNWVIIILILASLVVVMGASGCPKTNPGTCPTALNPPCYSKEQAGELSPTAVGGLVPDRCDCPPGTNFSGTRDVMSAGGPYKMCLCI